MKYIVPAVVRLCKKLGFDYAPALVGWDFHSGKNTPIIDGVIVCAEHGELISEAWEQEQGRLRQEKMKKKQNIVIKRWESLVKKVLIREQLKIKYGKENSEGGSNLAADIHQHEFTAESEYFDEKAKQWKKKCECGLVVVFEKL